MVYVCDVFDCGFLQLGIKEEDMDLGTERCRKVCISNEYTPVCEFVIAVLVAVTNYTSKTGTRNKCY